MSRSEALRRVSRVNDGDQVRQEGSAKKILVVIGLVVGVMLVAAVYIFSGNVLGIEESSFPPLKELPQIGRITKAEGPKRPAYEMLRTGEDAPDFSFVDPSGATKKLSDYKGQVVMLNFWATWCPYCVKEMPDIEAVYREEQAKGFIVLGINLDDEPEIARKFLQLRGVTFPSIMDSNGVAINLYRIQPVPASFFIDREGKLRAIQIGAMTKSVIKSKVDSLM